MIISIFINRPPPFIGGLQNVCLKVAKHFQESAGAQVRIIGFADHDNSTRRCGWEHEGVEVQELRRGWREDLLLRWVPFLKKRKATFPIAVACFEWAYSRQITHLCQRSSVFHYFGTGMEMNGYPVAQAAKKIAAKFVIEPAIHTGTWGDTWLDAPLYKKADLLLAHTDHEAGVIYNLGITKSKIRTIVHGVDFCNSGDVGRCREKHRIAGPMVLFLGRKTREKGVGRLLEAWPMVAEKFPQATLVLAGPKSEEFEKLKSESRDSPATSHSLPVTAPKAWVLNLDDLEEREKQDALAACDLLCVPSEGESFGMVYYEAWAYKKPVVALDLPVLRESIGGVEGGVLAESDPKSIAGALIKMLSKPELCREMGNRGYELALQHDWPNSVASYMDAYREAGIKF